MDLKALDLAAESLRHHKFVQVSPECPASPCIQPKPRSFSQPVSPARVVGETSKGVPIGQEPMNDCDVEKVRLILMAQLQNVCFCLVLRWDYHALYISVISIRTFRCNFCIRRIQQLQIVTDRKKNIFVELIPDDHQQEFSLMNLICFMVIDRYIR